MQDYFFDCQSEEIAIAAELEDNGRSLTLIWTTNDGLITGPNNELILSVGGPGSYFLEALDGMNGCNDVLEIKVEDRTEAPDLVLSQDTVITCLQPSVILSAAGSSNGQEFSYTWTTIGGLIMGSSDQETIEAGAAGIYTLEIRNTNTGCVSSGTIEVRDGFPPRANAGVDNQVCGTEDVLQAKLASGSNGRWISLSQAVVEDERSTTTTVFDLQPGDNPFVWICLIRLVRIIAGIR